MREHAKQLELYSKMFEEVSQKVDIEREFTLTMMAEKRFPEQNIQEFLETKVHELRGHQKGNNFRAGGSQGGPRSQSANRPGSASGVP